MTNYENFHIRGTIFSSSGINHPEYEVDIPSSSASKRNSPTPSDMGWSDYSINDVLTMDEDLLEEKALKSSNSEENFVKRK